MQALVSGIVRSLFGLVCVSGVVELEWPSNSRDVGQLGRCASERRRSTLHEELSVVDDSCACRRQRQEKVRLPVLNVLPGQTNVL